MTPRDLARCVEMAVNGTKSAYPAMQPADAFLEGSRNHGANAGRRRRRPAKPRAVRQSPRRKQSPINPPAKNLEIANEHA